MQHHRLRSIMLGCALAGGILIAASPSHAQETPPTTHPGDATLGHFPFLTVDAVHKQIRVDCQALHCEAPLEFFCCVKGTNEYESVLRSQVRPSHLHAALLMLGLKPGRPVHFDQAQQKWIPPTGPRLHISVEFVKDGKMVTMPAYGLMRDDRTKKPMPPMTWIFAGSRLIPAPGGGEIYAADQTGYLVSVVNFELTVIDIPDLASSANETLEWETDLSKMPPVGTPVTMIIEPARGATDATSPSRPDESSENNSGETLKPQLNESPSSPARPPGPIDQAQVNITADGRITLDSDPMDSPAALVKALGNTRDDRQVRVAVANAIEENPTARDVLNALTRAGIDYRTIPQSEARGEGFPAATQASSIDLQADDAMIQRLQAQWQHAVTPNAQALRKAAKAHYQVLTQLRQEQQRLIDEADKIQRLIDQLQKQYQDLTAPKTSGE